MGSWCYEDVYREYSELDWQGAFWAFAKRIRTTLEIHPALVIEGCFLPGSVTHGWLLSDMKVAGVNVEVRGLWERFEVCQGWIAARHARREISAAETGRWRCHSAPGGGASGRSGVPSRPGVCRRAGRRPARQPVPARLGLRLPCPRMRRARRAAAFGQRE